MDFERTPSFYTSQNAFEKYLKYTSFYSSMQKNLGRIAKLLRPYTILELGCATGDSSRYVANQCQDSQIIAIDNRRNIIEVAEKITTEKNITYKVNDMETITGEAGSFDLIYSLYAFHHIPDPLERKIVWLNQMFRNMKKCSFLIIGDLFLPEDDTLDLLTLWQEYGKESYRSVYANMLDQIHDLSPASLDFIREVASYSAENEHEVGRLAIQRQEEFLVKKSWLKTKAQETGFQIFIDLEINNLNDSIVVLQK